jgi:hypothetical protein
VESSGVACGVQLSAAAFALLRLAPADVAAAGVTPLTLDIKGKGPMQVYRIGAATPAAERLRELVDAPWPTEASPKKAPPLHDDHDRHADESGWVMEGRDGAAMLDDGVVVAEEAEAAPAEA